jgi:hypothetical protein
MRVTESAMSQGMVFLGVTVVQEIEDNEMILHLEEFQNK